MNEQHTNAQPGAPRQGEQRKGRQRSGRVVSAMMHKTCVVRVERQVKHPLYGKFLLRSSKMHVHDETNRAQAGDYVTIRETRPRSKTKTWELVSIDRPADPSANEQAGT